MDAVVKRAALEQALGQAMATAGEMRWGRDDCALWCANILNAALGYDGAARFRGRYRTRSGARRVLGRRIEPGAEQVGDIGILMQGDLPVTVICRAPGWFVARSEQGWSAIPAKTIRVIWAVA
jgi:hypothetical protein